MFNFTEKNRHWLAIWFLSAPDQDFMGTLYRDPDSEKDVYTFEYRLRFYNPTSTNPFDGKDEKIWYKMYLRGASSQEVVNKIATPLAEVAQSYGEPLNYLYVDGDNMKAMQLLAQQPWAHLKVANIAEYEKDDKSGVLVPRRIQELPMDSKGRFIPYFATLGADGEPNFKIADELKRQACAKKNLCWLCGQPLAYYMVFIGGPLSAQSRLFSDGPMHQDCAEYALVVCPYLARQSRDRNSTAGHAHSMMTLDKPEKFCLFITRGFKIEHQKGGEWLFNAHPHTKLIWHYLK